MQRLAEKKRKYIREMIIEAAEGLFSQHGYHNTQIMDIVKSVGMSAGTFYNYFRDKRDLFAQITRQNFSNFRTRIKEVRKPVNIWVRSDRIAKLNETFSAYFDYIDMHQQQFLILLRGSFGVDEELDDSVWNYYSDIAEDLAEDIRNWLDIGVIAGVNPHTLAYSVVGMAMHLGHSYLMEKKFTREQAIQTLTTLSNIIFESYLTEAGRKALDGETKAVAGGLYR
ncbi:MAG TPA: TetR/AcrR family transcriptional regulator [Desulfomonilia bacterium]|nr:TetR/AcrR family transcriptional regulator [Desulfomonilia bacterium]